MGCGPWPNWLPEHFTVRVFGWLAFLGLRGKSRHTVAISKSTCSHWSSSRILEPSQTQTHKWADTNEQTNERTNNRTNKQASRTHAQKHVATQTQSHTNTQTHTQRDTERHRETQRDTERHRETPQVLGKAHAGLFQLNHQPGSERIVGVCPCSVPQRITNCQKGITPPPILRNSEKQASIASGHYFTSYGSVR